ncbi:hypothetical protein FKP32DRAFT_1556406, partial [Trametes sanguinea]
HNKPMLAVSLLVYGPTYTLILLLPTDNLQDLRLEHIHLWVAIFYGLLSSQCKASEEQFDALIVLALTYRVFAMCHSNLTWDDFVLFTDQLIQATTDLHPLESTDDELQELAGWLHVNMP